MRIDPILHGTRALTLLLILAPAGCVVKYGDLGDFGDTDETGGSGGSGGSTTATTATSGGDSSSTGEQACTPGESKDGLCGNYCQCEPNGTWACTDKGCVAIGPGFEQTLGQIGGCADLDLFAVDLDGSVALHVLAPGLVAEAKAAGQPIEKSFSLPDPALTVQVLTGGSFASVYCTDAIDEPTIDLTYVPVAGAVSFTVTPLDSPDPSATVTTVFTDVVWQIADVPDSETVPMASFTMDAVPITWMGG